MPVTDMLMSGLSLMVVGMGIVFIFLLVLVFVMKGMSKLASLLEPKEAGNALSPQSSPGVGGDAVIRGDLIAVIGAAIARYRAPHD